MSNTKWTSNEISPTRNEHDARTRRNKGLDKRWKSKYHRTHGRENIYYVQMWTLQTAMVVWQNLPCPIPPFVRATNSRPGRLRVSAEFLVQPHTTHLLDKRASVNEPIKKHLSSFHASLPSWAVICRSTSGPWDVATWRRWDWKLGWWKTELTIHARRLLR